MKIVRTEKQFTQENLTIDFIKEAVAIACCSSSVRKYTDETFQVEISFEGRVSNGTISPWSDEYTLRGYVKKVSTVYIRLNNGFDSYAIIFDKSASIQGYFNGSDTVVGVINPARWTNLLLENGFLEIQ